MELLVILFLYSVKCWHEKQKNDYQKKSREQRFRIACLILRLSWDKLKIIFIECQGTSAQIKSSKYTKKTKVAMK